MAAGLLIHMCLAGGAGLALYSQKPVRAVIGLQIQTSYLEQQGQDYEVDEAMNRLTGWNGHARKNTGLCAAPVLRADPIPQWGPNHKFRGGSGTTANAARMEGVFGEEKRRLRGALTGYPAETERPLVEMEKRRYLVPYAEAEVQNLEGMRINQKRVTVRVVILRFRR